MKSKEQTPIEELIEQIRLYRPIHIKLDEEYLSNMIEKEKDFIKDKVLESLEEYEDKILQVVEKKADVKDYILRNRSKTKV
jgi:hypothetical protein